MRLSNPVSRTLPMLLLLGTLIAAPAMAQRTLTLPRPSQQASVSQRIGLTDIMINYHRPGVKGRQIWGQLVPNGLAQGQSFNNNNPFPWRAGANENTTISFSHEVSLGGTRVPAGTYGIHMIPGDYEWTVILSKHHQSWGSFFYDQEADAVRVTTTPVAASHAEWLQYGFEDLTGQSVVAYLRWEKKKIPFKIDIDTHAIVLENMRNELRSLPGFNAQAYLQAANYCLQNNINTEEGLAWAEQAVQRGRSFNTLIAKSGLLVQAGQKKMAQETEKSAFEIATEGEVNIYGYQLMGRNQMAHALEVFKHNVATYPDSWNVYDSLAECYEKSGKKKMAIENYKRALKMAPPDQIDRIETTLAKLQQSS